MALYEYRCTSDDCTHEETAQFPMGEAPKEKACFVCWGTMVRVYHSTPDIWKKDGRNVRAPGRQWAGGEQFDPKRFRAENPSYKGKLRGEM